MSDDTGKRCTKCGEVKPLSEFYPSARSRTGIRPSCKACDLAYQRSQSGTDHYKARKRRSARLYRAVHPERAQNRWQQLRDMVLDHYGRVCACCGSADKLSIDHPAGDGAAHRTELFGSRHAAGTRMYLWLIREGFPDGYQVLCMPCNQSKGSGPACLLHQWDSPCWLGH